MKPYMIFLTWLITFAALLGLACEPAASIDTDTEQVGIAEVSPETVVEKTEPEPVAAETPKEAEPTIADTPPEPEQVAVETPDEPEPVAVETPAEPPVAVEKPKEAPTTSAAQKADEADNKDVAVTVNGIVITESQIEEKIAPQMDRMSKQPGRKMPPSLLEQSKTQLKQRIIEDMIVETLLDEKVKENNIVITEEDVTNQINDMLAQQKMSLDDLKALLEARGTNYDLWKEQMQFPRRLAYQRLMEAQFDNRVNITEEDAQKYYSENTKQFEKPEQVRVSHILIRPDTADPNTDPNDAKAEAKVKAQSLLQRIRAGADFAELAKATGGYPSAPKGGDIGFGQKSDMASGRRGSWVQPFEKAAFELEVGQVSDVVETQYGYHIIKVTDHKDAGVTTLEEVKDDLINMLEERKKNELARQYVEDLKAGATIVYPPGKEPKPAQSPVFPGAPARRKPR